MMKELNEWAEGLVDRVPAEPGADTTFSAELFPTLPHSLTCRSLVIEPGFHDYDTWRIDYPQWSADKSTYAALGLAILSVVFHGESAVAIGLTSPRSKIKSLVITPPNRVDFHTGLELAATGVHYGVTPVQRHPWVSSGISAEELPWIKLTNAGDCVVTEEQRAQRDCLHGFGSLLGSARFARLLLDLSRPANEVLEVVLESEAGFRGVAPASAELRLWLPGADYWTEP
jgi:hypothetical protein